MYNSCHIGRLWLLGIGFITLVYVYSYSTKWPFVNVNSVSTILQSYSLLMDFSMDQWNPDIPRKRNRMNSHFVVGNHPEWKNKLKEHIQSSYFENSVEFLLWQNTSYIWTCFDRALVSVADSSRLNSTNLIARSHNNVNCVWDHSFRMFHFCHPSTYFLVYFSLL